ncbi:heme ABC exporter ATP-binding protein CcmA [soil metagenome]
MTRLVAKNLGCERGGRTVFTGVSFALAAGEVLELTGPNGAGKSTLLRLVAGLGTLLEGELLLEGGETELTIGQHCHYAAHQDALKTRLTVAENLSFWSGFLGGGDIAAALAAFDLAGLAGYPGGYLSAGQRRRLSLSRLVLIPRLIWLLDEPVSGLDARSQERLAVLMSAHVSQGGMIIAATHVALPVPVHAALALPGSP